ncbi:MAG: thiamine pyrophosphate-binding protein [bacterium]
MEKVTTIGQYLIEKINNSGVGHVFGIPGDYVINFFSMMEQSPLEIVGTCSEQGAAFAADAYARMNGLGALCITYCVGGLNTINAVAGAYAEKSPLILISGAPGVCERNSDYLLHHSIRDLNSQFNIFKEVTIASTQLDNPHTAAYEIDRVINACIENKRPVYIELPRDMINEPCVVQPEPNKFICTKHRNHFNEALKEAVDLIKNSKKPVIMGGIEIKRFNIENQFTELLESTGYPYCTTLLGKSIIDESHPQFLGVYMGKVGKENIRSYVEEADCLLILGALMTDTNLGTAQLDISKTIYATTDQLCIKHHYYKHIDLKEFIEALTKELKNDNEKVIYNPPQATTYVPQEKQPLKVNRFFERLNSFLSEDSLVICDVGDCLFGSADLKIPKNSSYLGPAYYTSMGYGIPATIGAGIIDKNVRPVVIVGDGAFQMTGHELSCFVKHDLKPIVFVINNHGYTTQRFLKDGSYNEIQDWKYHKFPEIVGGGLGLEVFTEDELELALDKASKNTESFTIINMHVDKYDKSDTLGRLTSFLGQKTVEK